MQNSLERFSEEIFMFITGEAKGKKGLLIKKHSDHLHVQGDFSFPNTVKSWHTFFNQNLISGDTDDDLMKIINKTQEDLKEQSKKWDLHVTKVQEAKGRMHVFLDRPTAIRIGLIEAMKNNEYILERMKQGTSQVLINPNCEDLGCITSLRLKYLKKAATNLYAIVKGYREIDQEVVLCRKSNEKHLERKHIVVCGNVEKEHDKVVSADEYIEFRQVEMSLIAQHKYGIRQALDPKWKEFTTQLGESASIFELLQNKPSSNIKVSVLLTSDQPKKGAQFVLYNCARLATILNKHSKMVKDGTYPPLPDIEDIDLSLLKHEDEWQLIFNYILGFPSMIDYCVEISDNKCEFRTHHICSFLNSMVRVFSQYYRKIRILTQPRKHLMPELHARIHMLNVLYTTLKTCLLILDIKSVTQM